ncbi:thiamine-phosphate kinase [Candidatus Pelagibacter sp. FZCC0015]|uniref:thiamine-phosphate kinase n=1 Tax=Candidatus Pelagibacter sp. FZCC0015 TaxID=2268451 RepID=UPI0011A874FA|nr:thiamine-phosphate kinase [Candidatus Pelagibacter sp. FZCC0015]
MHEFDLINNYFFKIAKKNKSALNLNDDVFFDKKRGVVISVDTYNIGTHFYDFKSPDLVIKKILRSSVSDLICKGVKPKFYFISGSGNKKTFTKNNLYKISKSLKSEQNKFNIDLCGGDTTFSNKLSFTITSLGYANKIIYRNKAKLNDDIYVTGNLGDSYIGLKVLSNKARFKNKDKLFFLDKYYKPELPLNLTKYLLKFANSSIDVSDGLIDDLAKMINRQSLSFHLFENKIPVSNKLSNLIKKQRLNKINLISNGDDYQVLFTANINKARIIQKASKTTGIKITKIGKIVSGKHRSLIFDEKGKQIRAKTKGYIHQF